MKHSEPLNKQEITQTESTLGTAVIGVIVGCILGTIAMLFWYLSSGEFVGVMIGSGLIGLICVMPLASLIIGGIPGGIVGGLIGLMLDTQIRNF